MCRTEPDHIHGSGATIGRKYRRRIESAAIIKVSYRDPCPYGPGKAAGFTVPSPMMIALVDYKKGEGANVKKAIHPPLGAKRHCPRALRIVLLFVILGTFLMLASSCAGTAVSKVTITDWVPKNTPTSSLTVTYRFSNLGSKTITSYWICFEITFAGGGKQQYVHHATETIEGNTIVWPLTAEISLGGTYTVTDVVKLNHGVTTG